VSTVPVPPTQEKEDEAAFQVQKAPFEQRKASDCGRTDLVRVCAPGSNERERTYSRCCAVALTLRASCDRALDR